MDLLGGCSGGLLKLSMEYGISRPIGTEFYSLETITFPLVRSHCVAATGTYRTPISFGRTRRGSDMVLRQRIAGLICLVATVAVGFAAPAQVWAQAQGAGVIVDADGVLRTQIVRDPTGALARQRLAEGKAALNPDVARPSKLRKVSLNRLEAAIAERMANGQEPTDDMRYLAGLTRIQHVFYYPETNDIVIAGPAEGYVHDLSGRVVGIVSGRAALELQDLVVALRAFPPSGRATPLIGCSIDATQEGLARMQQYLTAIAGRVTPRDAGRLTDGMRDRLGLQNVTINGISPRTHFAQVLVEADYRMKLIGIGLENPPVNIGSYVGRANPSDVSRNAMQRWYFVPNYECVRVSDDDLAMELVGDGVKLVGADEVVRADGSRAAVGNVDRASQAFVTAFTTKYPELADKSPVYAQLRNLIDMVIAAAFMQQQDYYSHAGWKMDVLGREDRFPVETFHAPKQVETAVNAVWKGSTLMTPIGGGVVIHPSLALATDHLLNDEQGQLKDLRKRIKLDALEKGQWWWD
jgi:hypothetical protein